MGMPQQPPAAAAANPFDAFGAPPQQQQQQPPQQQGMPQPGMQQLQRCAGCAQAAMLAQTQAQLIEALQEQLAGTKAELAAAKRELAHPTEPTVQMAEIAAAD